MDPNDVKAAAAAKVAAAKAGVAGGAGEGAAPELWEVRGPEGGRRRAGLRFTPQPVRVDTADLTPSEAAAIAGDPALSVKVVARPAAPEQPPEASFEAPKA